MMLIKHLRAHIFIYGSLLVHLILVAMFYRPTPSSANAEPKVAVISARQTPLDQAQAERALASDYVRRAYQVRINDMQDIKQLIEQVEADGNLDVNALVKKQVQERRTDGELTYQQLYQSSLLLRQQIEALVTNKPVQSLPLSMVDGAQLNIDEMLQAVVDNHQQAQQSLAVFHRTYSKERAGGQGTSVQLSGAIAANNKGGDAGGGTGSQLGSLNINQNMGSLQYQHSDKLEGEPLPANISQQAFFPVAAKTLGRTGRKADRVYIDTWYMLGPFDNQTALSQTHPPESHIDLDAVYPGKDDRLIRWQFFQTNHYPIVPDNAEGNATYYGYTELYFDQPTTLWVGLGCDDNCKLWLDHQLVWQSGTGDKAWFVPGGYRRFYHELATWGLTESYRHIQFNQGRNSLLFRLDNGFADVFFSMVLIKDAG